jgi:hypothetical protein
LQNLYAGEAVCKAFFKEKRSKEFSNCGRRGSVHLPWEEKAARWRCKECKHTMSLKLGTVMEDSKLGFPVRGDGTIDDQERAIVEEIGVWMKLNSESIMLHVLGRNLEKDLLWKM